MKIQCSCGMKYAFDLTPEMARTPIKFVCKSCGVDSSEMVNQLVRQQLGLAAPESTWSIPTFAPDPTTEPVVARVKGSEGHSTPPPPAPIASPLIPPPPTRPGSLRVTATKAAAVTDAAPVAE